MTAWRLRDVPGLSVLASVDLTVGSRYQDSWCFARCTNDVAECHLYVQQSYNFSLLVLYIELYMIAHDTVPATATFTLIMRTQVSGFRGEASLAQVNLQGAPSTWTYERRASVKLAKSQLRTVQASFENPSLEPKVFSYFPSSYRIYSV